MNNYLLSDIEYEQNFSDINPGFETKNTAVIEANRCLYCYDAPCMRACPTAIDVPKFIKQISTDNVKGSAYTILSSNIMGASCSKVCSVEKLCEGACVYKFLNEPPIQIAKLQRYASEKAIQLNWNFFKRKPSNGKKVAVVGAGPAGLSCAHALSQEGVCVTLFEKELRSGGLMTYGVAAYKVTSKFCEDEINYITSLGGITINYDQELGKNISFIELQQNYDAVFLAFGVGLTRKLNILGENLQGVEDAITYIYNIRTNDYSSIIVGNKVAVIGLGNTAIDAATQVKRLGAKDVTLIYHASQAEMSCTQHNLNLAKLDGCKIIWMASPKEIIGTNGHVTKLIYDKMQFTKDIIDGRRTTEKSGETAILDVDLVIKATGQMPFENLFKDIKIDTDQGKIIVKDKSTTNINGVFAGGDCVNGGAEVVNAVQAGKDGAKAILKYLL